VERKLAARFVVGLTLLFSTSIVYLIYQLGGQGPAELVLLGVLLSSAGYYLCLPYLKFLQPFKRMVPIFAVAIVLLGLFPPSDWQNSIVGSVFGSQLMPLTTRLGVLLLNAEGIGATVGGGSTIVLPAASKVAGVTVGQACGGIQEVFVFSVAFAVMYIDVGRKAPMKAMLLLPVGLVGVYLVSIVRVDAVVLTGYLYGFDAMETFHLYAGFLLYLAFISVFWYLSLKWIGIGSRAESEVPESRMNDRASPLRALKADAIRSRSGASGSGNPTVESTVGLFPSTAECREPAGTPPLGVKPVSRGSCCSSESSRWWWSWLTSPWPC
jgi:exosortase/archaeosortase family protein